MVGHMRDRGSLIQLLDSFGIEQSGGDNPEPYTYTVREYESGSEVVIGAGCEFHFDANGYFVKWSQ